MRARLKLKAGAPGTKRLQKEYGDRLVCVRYRYDGLSMKRYKTVELIVSEAPWEPMGSAAGRGQRVYLRVGPREKRVREKVKGAGGRWHPDKRVWSLPYEQMVRLGYQRRLVAAEELP
jgi:hypothetical protein